MFASEPYDDYGWLCDCSLNSNRDVKAGIYLEYAELVKKRKKYNISQTKIAEASGYSKTAISAWELGKSTPSDYELSRIDNVLSAIIKDIEECVFDVRKKKRITHSKIEKRNLPAPIRSADDYRERLSLRTTNETPYSKSLSDLYHRAQKQKDDNSPKTIALFSGCGGLSLGFAAEGFNLVGHVEIEASANRIYNENFPRSRLLRTDICEISDDDMQSNGLYPVSPQNIDNPFSASSLTAIPLALSNRQNARAVVKNI